jgi:5'-3' exonuclease
MQATPLYLIDASIYIFRAYYSLPERWHSPQGYPLNAVYGYTSFLLDLLKKLGESGSHALAVSFDESLGSCFRNSIYADYKVSRERPDEALAFQLKACRKLTELLGMPCFAGSEYEADDYIATLATRGRVAGHWIMVVSRDKDLGQLLLDDRDRLWDFSAGEQLDRQGFADKFGVLPEQFADYQGLVGDHVDDIPGVPAIGAKTGARLIQAYGCLERLASQTQDLQELGLRGTARISKNLATNWEDALLSRELTRLADRIRGVELPPAYRLEAGALKDLMQYLQSINLQGGVMNRCRTLLQQLEA